MDIYIYHRRTGVGVVSSVSVVAVHSASAFEGASFVVRRA